MLIVKNFLKETKEKGIGVFAGEDIKKGAIVYIDEDFLIKTFSSAEIKNFQKVVQDFITNYSDYDKENDCWYLDCDNSRFINHSETQISGITLKKRQ